MHYLRAKNESPVPIKKQYSNSGRKEARSLRLTESWVILNTLLEKGNILSKVWLVHEAI